MCVSNRKQISAAYVVWVLDINSIVAEQTLLVHRPESAVVIVPDLRHIKSASQALVVGDGVEAFTFTINGLLKTIGGGRLDIAEVLIITLLSQQPLICLCNGNIDNLV